MEAHIRQIISKRTSKINMFERALIAKDIAIHFKEYLDWRSSVHNFKVDGIVANEDQLYSFWAININKIN